MNRLQSRTRSQNVTTLSTDQCGKVTTGEKDREITFSLLDLIYFNVIGKTKYGNSKQYKRVPFMNQNGYSENNSVCKHSVSL